MKNKRVKTHDCREWVKHASRFHEYKVRYSSECDFSEKIIISGLEKILNADIYLNKKKVDVSSIQNLSLYYPFGIRCSYKNQEGKMVIDLTPLDYNTLQIEKYGEYYIDANKKYQQNWYEAIIANGFTEEFAWKWVYEQAYREV